MQPVNYYKDFYDLQDMVLPVIAEKGKGFYLTGGTALGRVFLQHRHSEDLDFFVNNSPDFTIMTEAVVNNLISAFKDGLKIITVDQSFVRCNVTRMNVLLKIDFVNDIDYRFREFQSWEKFPMADNSLSESGI